MPELPEVQCFVDDINRNYAGAGLAGFKLHRKGLRRDFDAKAFAKAFAKGCRLKTVRRIGKRMVLGTEGGAFLVSLGMSGAFHPAHPENPALHEHVTLLFEDGRALGFVDPRRFGDWIPHDDRFGAGAVDGLDGAGLLRLFSSREVRSAKRPVKALLLDQNFIGGVGNIYALEALFEAGVHPESPCCALSDRAWALLARALPRIFQKAIVAGGSTISSYERHGHAEGGFQEHHKVYGREGEKCRKRGCAGVITRIPQGGRSSWFCPNCQPSKRSNLRRPG